MRDDRDELDELVLAGAICPVPDCGALVVVIDEFLQTTRRASSSRFDRLH